MYCLYIDIALRQLDCKCPYLAAHITQLAVYLSQPSHDWPISVYIMTSPSDMTCSQCLSIAWLLQ